MVAWLFSCLFRGYPWLFLLRGYFLAVRGYPHGYFPAFRGYPWLFLFSWLFFAPWLFPWLFCTWLFFWNTQKNNTFSQENSREIAVRRVAIFNRVAIFITQKTNKKIAAKRVAILYGRVFHIKSIGFSCIPEK